MTKHVERAFPSGDGQYGAGPNHDYGMTLRDYFAGQALAGLAASIKGPGCASWDYYSEAAYKIADAMMDEREKRSHGERADEKENQ